MKIDDMLPAGGLEALASQLGIPQDQARRGVDALLPSLIGGMGERSRATDGGALDAEVQRLGGPALAHNVVGPEPTDVARGNQMLGNIFGSKDVSRQVAGQASATSGLDPALLKKMLPILAMLLAGHLSQRSAGQQGGLGGILGTVLGGLAGGGGVSGGGALGSGAGGGLGGVLGSIFGWPPLIDPSALDQLPDAGCQHIHRERLGQDMHARV